jgi:hypothetical protein
MPTAPTSRIIAAVFDLKSSTDMVSRPESLHQVSLYLSEFLNWLTTTVGKKVGSPHIASLTPQGDGAVVIWECSSSDNTVARRVITACRETCHEFEQELSQQLKDLISLHPLPSVLRCGIAEGDAAVVYLSKVKSKSYFGFCIALASRLQRLAEGISFAVSGRVEVDQGYWQDDFTRRVAYVRGIGPEIVYVLKTEFEKIPGKQKNLLPEPGGSVSPDPSDGLLTHEDALEFADAINMRNTKDPGFLIVASQKLKSLAERYPFLPPILVEQAKLFRIGEHKDGLLRAISLLEKAVDLDPHYRRASYNRVCYLCLLAKKESDPEEQSRITQKAFESLRPIVVDDPTWRHWVQHDPDLQWLRESDNWESFLQGL